MNITSAEGSYAPPVGQLFRASVELYTRSLERTAQVQKEILDSVADQNAASVEVWRRALRTVPGATAWLNFLEQGMSNTITAQKQLVGVLADQTSQVAQTAESEGEQAIAAVRNISHAPRTEKHRRSKAHRRRKPNHKSRSKRQ